jgi:hypothetical protein
MAKTSCKKEIAGTGGWGSANADYMGPPSAVKLFFSLQLVFSEKPLKSLLTALLTCFS